jgi:hypothetical protein
LRTDTEILPAAAVKLADVEPAATDTVAGIVNAEALLDNATVTAVPAAWFKETVQFEVLPLFRDVGAHETLLTTVCTSETVVIVPPVPVTVTAEPSAVAPKVLLTEMTLLETLGDTVTFTVATTPFDIRLVFRSARIQL